MWYKMYNRKHSQFIKRADSQRAVYKVICNKLTLGLWKPDYTSLNHCRVIWSPLFLSASYDFELPLINQNYVGLKHRYVYGSSALSAHNRRVSYMYLFVRYKISLKLLSFCSICPLNCQTLFIFIVFQFFKLPL